MGGEYPVLGDGIQRRCLESGTRRPGLAAAAEPRLVSSRIHVYHVLRFSHIRKLDVVETDAAMEQSNSMDYIWQEWGGN